MAKVQFKRYETDLEAQESDVIDGQFIVTKEGSSYIDYGTDRIPTNGTLDSAMSGSSANAVKNNVIKSYIDAEISVLETSLTNSTTYSATETVIGTYLDETLYRKVIDFGTLPNAATKSVNHGITGLDKVVNLYGTAYSSSTKIPLPYFYPNSSYINYGIGFESVTSTQITISAGTDRSSYTAEVTIEYTKA